jgi:hypothetical protein
MRKSTITITINDDQVAELVAYLVSKNIKGFTVVDTTAGVAAAQTAQAKAETKTEVVINTTQTKEENVGKTLPTSTKNADGTRTVIINGEEIIFNPATHRIFNCMVLGTHATGCKGTIVGRNDMATELRFLQKSMLFNECHAADLVSRIKKEKLVEDIAHLEGQLARIAELDAKRQAAMDAPAAPKPPTTNDGPSVSYPSN